MRKFSIHLGVEACDMSCDLFYEMDDVRLFTLFYIGHVLSEGPNILNLSTIVIDVCIIFNTLEHLL